jgi:hypothetical protein
VFVQTGGGGGVCAVWWKRVIVLKILYTSTILVKVSACAKTQH